LPTLQGLTDQVAAWLDRGDVGSLIPGWVTMVETDISESLRARCMVVMGNQPIDAPYIALPSDFAEMESIRDGVTGELLTLEDEFSGHWSADVRNSSAVYGRLAGEPVTSYRLVGTCIEFLPHPYVPSPPDPTWTPQSVLMGWYQKPKPLLAPSDTNPVLNEHFAIYLFGVCKYGAMFELDDDRAAQMTAAYDDAVTRANLWKQRSDYSGAPLRAVQSVVY
jgi:hypothetical protein